MPRSRFVQRLVIGLFLGVAVGLFLGERARIFASAADAFVKLLQMAVLPYVTVSIIGSIGALRVEDVRRLGLRTGLVLLALWMMALGCVFLMPLTFPHIESARFFSTTLVERAPPFDVIGLYIPSNPFFALANNIVPAVVVFSLVLGVALMGVPRRQILLDVLDTAGAALGRATKFVVRLTPYGLFAIAATTAGTLHVDQAQQLELYLLAYGAFSLLLALWVLPGLVHALTPIPMRAIFTDTREAVLTAAVAGDLFIVLPVLIDACKALVARHTTATEHERGLPDVIVPVSYNFPHSGKLLSISFVLFAGWFADATIEPGRYLQLAATGVVTLFGSISAAMPFLLDTMRVPVDTFQLFVASSVINSRFGTLVAAMHTVAMALLGTCAATGTLRWRVRPLLRYAVVTTLLTASVVGGVRFVGSLLTEPATTADVLASMSIAVRAESTLASEQELSRETEAPATGTRLRLITSRRSLRACYVTDALPYAYANRHDDLVGYDVAAMHRLALELGTRLVFVSIGRERLDQAAGVAELLKGGTCDIVVGGVAVTTGRARLMQFSTSYLDETLGFVVRDADRTQFETWEDIRRRGAITVAAPDVDYYRDKVRARLPLAQLRPVSTVAELFQQRGVDALAMTAERGSAWTLRYPQYTVVVPQPDPIRVPLAYGLPLGEPEFASFVNTWIELKRRDGTFDGLYQYWILGRNAMPVEPRWSVIRDVLHWVE